MSNGTGSNPLFVHAIVLFVVAACVLVAGILGIVAAAKDMNVDTGASRGGGVQGSLYAVQDAQMKARSAQSDVQSLTNPSGAGSVGGAISKMSSAKRLGDTAKKLGPLKVLIPSIVICIIAAGIGAAAFFLLKEKNWARYAGFGCLSAVLLYGVWVLSAWNAILDEETGAPLNEFSVIWPIGLTLIAILAGKFLWDLFVEKFAEPAPAAA
jgi:hypothetical protein